MKLTQPDGLHYPSTPWIRQAVQEAEASELLRRADELLRNSDTDTTVAAIVAAFEDVVVDVAKYDEAKDQIADLTLERNNLVGLVTAIYEVATGKLKVKGSKLASIADEIRDTHQTGDVDLSLIFKEDAA